MFLMVYSISDKLIVQTSKVIKEGILQIEKKDGTRLLTVSLSKTNYIKTTQTIPAGEYYLKIFSEGCEYKKQFRI